MLNHAMLPSTTTAPTPIDTFCQVFIASTFYVLTSRDGSIRHTIPYVRRGRNVSGLDEDKEIKTVSYIAFGLFHSCFLVFKGDLYPTTSPRIANSRSLLLSVRRISLSPPRPF